MLRACPGLGTSGGWTEKESEQCMYVYSVAQSCLTLCNPMDCSLPGPSVHGILQARILEWTAISFSKNGSVFTSKTMALTGFWMWADKWLSSYAQMDLLSQPTQTTFFHTAAANPAILISCTVLWFVFLHQHLSSSNALYNVIMIMFTAYCQHLPWDKDLCLFCSLLYPLDQNTAWDRVCIDKC